MSGNQPTSVELATAAYISGVSSNGALAAQSFWTWNQDSPATYSAASDDAHKWSNDASGNTTGYTSAAGTPGGTVTYAFDPSDTWTPAQQQAFVATLTLWSDEANIHFTQVSNAAAADVLLSLGNGTGTYEQSAPATVAAPGSTAIPDQLPPSSQYGAQAGITFDTSGFYGTLGSFSPSGSYGYSSLVHEAGHLLGLGHSGPYSDSASTASIDAAQASPFDSRQWSVMSYIYPGDASAAYYGSYTVTGTNWTVSTRTTSTSGGTTTTTTSTYQLAPQTPMALDILAAQQLYGAATATALSGGQVFGFNCNITDAAEPFFDFSINVDPVVTLWDSGTGNTLDLSGYAMACTVDLSPGTFSSIGGLTNNLGIAFGTQIDTAIGGAGNDVFTVNADSDTINGGGGVNTAVFSGVRAAYTISGTAAALKVVNTATGASDSLSNIQDLRFADGAVAAGQLSTSLTDASDFNGDGKSDILFQNIDGTIDIWLMNGQSIASSGVVAEPGAAWHAVATGDFDGDGKSDILFQNDDGRIDIWQMNGQSIASSGVAANPGPSWHAVGTGDFNGDGKSDILFQNDDGSIDIWQMNGQSIAASGIVADPGPTWHALGVGDFNGDGKSDILFQNDDGRIDIWQMNGQSIASSGVVASPGPSWHAAGVGDFNGDGKSDILFQNNDGTIDIWQMNGNTISVSGVVADPGPAWHALSVGDYNGDGKSDILFQNDDGQIDIWQMNGNAIVTTGVVANPSAIWHAIGQGGMNFIDGTQSSGALAATIMNDDFVFTTASAGLHTISGFNPFDDVVTLNQSTFGSYAAVQANEAPNAGGTLITLGGGASLLLAGIQPSTLAAKNFI